MHSLNYNVVDGGFWRIRPLFPCEHSILWMSNASRKLNINARAFVTLYACIFGVVRHTPAHLSIHFSLSLSSSSSSYFFGNWQTLKLCLCAYICGVQARNRYGTLSMARARPTHYLTANRHHHHVPSTPSKPTSESTLRIDVSPVPLEMFIEMPCAAHFFSTWKKPRRRMNNMFKSLMANGTKQYAWDPLVMAIKYALRKEKNCNYKRDSGARAGAGLCASEYALLIWSTENRGGGGKMHATAAHTQPIFTPHLRQPNKTQAVSCLFSCVN